MTTSGSAGQFRLSWRQRCVGAGLAANSRNRNVRSGDHRGGKPMPTPTDDVHFEHAAQTASTRCHHSRRAAALVDGTPAITARSFKS